MLWQKLVENTRINDVGKKQTSFTIIDAQSIKNTDSTKEKGYDAGKKVSGIKRHIVVDTDGLPHGIHITTAEINRADIEIAKKK